VRPTLIDAVISLIPDAQVTCWKNTVEWHNYPTSPITEQEITAELTRLQQEYDNKNYQRLRAAEYPPIGDQLDALFHAGVFPPEMTALLQEVKNKYPKPN